MSKQTQSERELDIMLAYDGEGGSDSGILAEPGSADLARGLDETAELVRGYLELATDDADDRLAGLWDRVERRLSSNGVAPVAVELATAADAPASRSPRRSLMQRLTEWFESHRGHFVTGAISAAAVALIMLQFGGETVKTEVRTVTTVSSQQAGQLPVSSPPPTGSPAEVESLEVYQGSGTILTLPDSDGEGSTSVIWISPDDAGDTMEGPI